MVKMVLAKCVAFHICSSASIFSFFGSLSFNLKLLPALWAVNFSTMGDPPKVCMNFLASWRVACRGLSLSVVLTLVWFLSRGLISRNSFWTISSFLAAGAALFLFLGSLGVISGCYSVPSISFFSGVEIDICTTESDAVACSGDLLAAGAFLFFSFSRLISGCCAVPSSSFLFKTDVCTAESDTGVCSGDLVWGVGDLADSTLPDDSVLCGSCCTLGDGELREGDGVAVRVGVLYITLRAGDGEEQVL